MEQTWKIDGTYAEWRLTIAIVPTNGGGCDNAPASNLESLAEHFRTLVEMVEAHRELDHLASSLRTSG